MFPGANLDYIIWASVVVIGLLIVLGVVWLLLRRNLYPGDRSRKRQDPFLMLEKSSVMTPEERRQVRLAIAKKLELDQEEKRGKRNRSTSEELQEIANQMKYK